MKSRRVALGLATGLVLHALANKTGNRSEASFDNGEANGRRGNEEEESDKGAPTVEA